MNKKIRLYCFFIFYILFLEIVAHYACFNNFNIGITALFGIAIGIILGIICSLIKKELINKILAIILSIVVAIIYCAEIVYFKMYESFFSLSAIMMVGQVTEGADQIFTVITHNIGVLSITFIPILILIVSLKFWNFKTLKLPHISLLLAILLIIHGGALFTITLDKDGTYSNYQIYNNIASPITSVERFGILTTLRIDIEKSLFNTNEGDILTGNLQTPDYTENNKLQYNQIDIDWKTVVENQNNKNIKQISTYFSSQMPTEKNEYTGMFKDKNVVFILAESLYKPAISEELTPTLYKMMTEGFNFENYYVPLYPTSTADGEYMLEWSLYPIIGNAYNLYNSRNNYHPYGFVNGFSNFNYKVSAYHGFAAYYYNREEYFKTQGYNDYGFCDTSLNMKCQYFHASDLTMVQNSIAKYINEDKFFTYYVSISGHGKYDYDSNFIVRQNWNLVKDLNYSKNVKGYLAGTIELDKALEYLMQGLEAAGKLDDTVFVLSPDHWPYYFKTKMNELEELAGEQIYDKFDVHKNTLMIYNSAMEKSVTVDKLASSIDVLPTLLNLMGVEYDSRLLMGKDILSTDDSLVIFSDYSWMTKLGRYNGKNFIPASEDIVVTDEYIENINSIVKQKILVSSLIQKNNYYKNLFSTIEKTQSTVATESEVTSSEQS